MRLGAGKGGVYIVHPHELALTTDGPVGSASPRQIRGSARLDTLLKNKRARVLILPRSIGVGFARDARGDIRDAGEVVRVYTTVARDDDDATMNLFKSHFDVPDERVNEHSGDLPSP